MELVNLLEKVDFVLEGYISVVFPSFIAPNALPVCLSERYG
jgi:hypothetical protein